jgi:Rab family protein
MNIVILVGDMGVGKTSLISQYIKNIFPENPLPTIAIEFSTKIIQINSFTNIKMQIWDTTGQEKYKSITSHHYRKAVGALLVYDVTRHSSFENCVKWLSEIRNYTDKDCVICLIGNKIDLLENKKNKREVPRTEAENFAKRNRIIFFELSAKKSGDINRCIEIMIKKIYDIKKESYKGSGSISESFIVRDSVIQGEENSNYVCC